MFVLLFDVYFTFHVVAAHSMTRVTRLQGRLVSSYVTLPGRHRFTGMVTFLGTLRASTVDVVSSIDEIQVNAESLLLTSSSQNHAGV